MLLELAARHGMLSVEFWRFIGISANQEKRKLSQYNVYIFPSCEQSQCESGACSIPLAVMS